jgi:anti-sigma regulatory factor (Ser/Thr protein kinase)
VRQGVADFARAHGVLGEDLTHFLTALGEAMANAIEHSSAAEPLEIDVRVAGDLIVATVHDAGRGFSHDPAQAIPAPEAERGRGMGIIRHCSDIFSVSSAPGKGTTVTLGRYLPPHSNGAA